MKIMHWISISILLLAGAAHGQTVAELKEKIIDLQNLGELGFKDFHLCNNIIGYGQFVPAESSKVKAGSELKFYYEPVNLYTNRRGGTYQVWYTQDMLLYDESGELIYNGKELLNFNYQTTSPVMDYFATNSLNLGNLPPGKYTFKAVVHDKMRNASAEQVFPFEIVP